MTPVALSPFALAVPGPSGCPQYYPLYTGGGVLLFDNVVRPLPGSDPNARKATGLRLESKTSADTVSITATVLYGDFDHEKAVFSVEKIPHETIATHSGKLNDEVAFPELERVGLEPVTFRIVTTQSETPYHPILRSNAPSLQIDYAPVDRNLSHLTLHNLAAKAVVAFQIGSSADGESGWSMATMPRIASGATSQTDVSDSPSATIVAGTCMEDSKSATIFLQAALFDDFSYEGDMRIAATLAARRLGHDLQRQRIKSLAEPILSDPNLDVNSTAERIRAAIKQLSIEPGSDAMARLRAQFPDLPESAKAGLASESTNEMKSVKELTDEDLQRYETESGLPGKTPASFARWWALDNKD